MDKKDIYEHLAEIYLDASLKKRKKEKIYSPLFKNLFLISILVLFCVTIFSVIGSRRQSSLNSEITLILNPDVVKINFNFNPTKKEIYSISLNKLDLRKFKALAFSVKKKNSSDNISLRVEFVSSFKERAEIYLKSIPHRWQDYKINLSDFKGVSEWSEMLNLSFIVEEWNVRQKQDIVYLDDIRFIR